MLCPVTSIPPQPPIHPIHTMFQTSRTYRFGIQMALSLILVAGASQAAVVFNEDFESGIPSEISGAGSLAGTEGFGAFGFGNQYLLNDSWVSSAGGNSTVLTLAGLGNHSLLSVSLSLAILDSWDGENADSGGCCGFDRLVVTIDGVEVFNEVFVSRDDTTEFGTPTHSLPAITPPNSGHYASSGTWFDSAYTLSLVVPHTDDDVTITWQAVGDPSQSGSVAWQGGGDESFAIDNVEVATRGQTNGVPDGGSAALMLGLSLMGLTAARRSMARQG